jgi:hypothetical protein
LLLELWTSERLGLLNKFGVVIGEPGTNFVQDEVVILVGLLPVLTLGDGCGRSGSV